MPAKRPKAPPISLSKEKPLIFGVWLISMKLRSKYQTLNTKFPESSESLEERNISNLVVVHSLGHSFSHSDSNSEDSEIKKSQKLKSEIE